MITVVTAGRFVAPRTQNLKKRFGVGAATPPTRSDVSPVARAARSFLVRTRRPAKPRMAGSSVSAATTATPTAADPTAPIMVRKGMPATLRPSRAIITVMPANTTAEPAVPRARPTDSGTEIPARSWSRWRETMKRE